MTQEQLKRANKAVFPVLAVIMGYTALSLVAFLLMSSAEAITWRSYLQLITAVGALIVSTVLFVTKKDTNFCGNGMLICAYVMYAVIRMVGTTEDSCMYAFPILIVTMTYLNVRMIVLGNVVVLGSNILRLLMQLSTISETGNSTVVVSLFVCILVAFGSIKITRLLVRFNAENMSEIMTGAKKQEENNKTMALVADNITKHFVSAMEMMDTLQESFNTGNESMENIAGSAESTAEAVQSEAEICGEIRNQTDQAGQVTEDMFTSSKKVKESVTDGVNSIHELRSQAENVSKASGIVNDVINELTSKVKEVESFVDTILSISSQTNLLALNASIEAARAGAAGKGFSVVAEEIRELSEDTKEASSHITTIIQALNADTLRANNSISDAVKSVEKQNGLIGEAENNFDKVAEEVENLMNNIQDTKNIMEKIVSSSNVIYDNISQLSASSEEVAASSGEGLSGFHVMFENLQKCREVFEAINRLAQELKGGYNE